MPKNTKSKNDRNEQVDIGHVLISQMLVGGPLNILSDAFVTLVNL